MNENPILPARIFLIFFHLFSTPKFSPLLPTTYQPLPPSLHRQSSRDVEREGAWSKGTAPTRDPGKHFFLCVYFVCLWSYATQDTQRCNAAPQAAFASSSFLCSARSCKEEGDGSCRRLLLHLVESCCSPSAQLHAVELLQHCNAAPCCRAALQRRSVLRSCCSTAPRRRRRQLSSPSSSCYGGAL